MDARVPRGGVAMKPHKFKVKLFGQEVSSVAALKPLLDTIETLRHSERVPVNPALHWVATP